MREKLLIGFLLFLFADLKAQYKDLVSGPMLGHIELRTANVWLEMKPGVNDMVLLYWEKGMQKASGKKMVSHKQETAFPNVFKFLITGLEPGLAYQYQITSGSDPRVLANGEFTTQQLWQYRNPAPDFSFLSGSCSYVNDPVYDRPGKPYGKDSSIFETMAKDSAAFMLWLGDNWYYREVDFQSEWGLNYRASRDRSQVALQPLLKAMPQYAIWDDHDYGPNDSDKGYILKDASRKVFMNSWINPSYGENGQGVYTKVSYNDVDIFMLDGRWFRTNDLAADSINGKPNPDKLMFGKQQMEWLKNALRFSQKDKNVSFRIIVSGSQVLNAKSPFECLRQYPAEFDELLDFLQDEKIDGVVFLTGDRHHSEIVRRDRVNAYPLFDVTPSPLTSGMAKLAKEETDYPERVFYYDNSNNFSKFIFTGKGKERKMTVEFKDVKGAKVGEWSIFLKDVTNAKNKTVD